MIVIGIFGGGGEQAHDLGVCDLFLAIHGDVSIVDYVEGVSSFDALGGFVGMFPMPWQRHLSSFAWGVLHVGPKRG